MATDTQLVAAIERLGENLEQYLDQQTGQLKDALEHGFERLAAGIATVADKVEYHDAYLVGIDNHLEEIELALRRLRSK